MSFSIEYICEWMENVIGLPILVAELFKPHDYITTNELYSKMFPNNIKYVRQMEKLVELLEKYDERSYPMISKELDSNPALKKFILTNIT